jgi:hypothetical protein
MNQPHIILLFTKSSNFDTIFFKKYLCSNFNEIFLNLLIFDENKVNKKCHLTKFVNKYKN